MSASITLILPVHDAQKWIAEKVDMVLDELTQLAPEFEVIIVDDGSIDDTYTVALELESKYPQVKAMRQHLRYGMDSAEKRGMAIADGEFIVVPDDAKTLEASDLHRLWKVRHDPSLVMIVNQATTGDDLVYSRRVDQADDRLLRGRTRSGRSAGGMRMIRRDALAQFGRPKVDLTSAPIVIGATV